MDIHTHIYIHIHSYIYIYIYIQHCICIYSSLFWPQRRSSGFLSDGQERPPVQQKVLFSGRRRRKCTPQSFCNGLAFASPKVHFQMCNSSPTLMDTCLPQFSVLGPCRGALLGGCRGQMKGSRSCTFDSCACKPAQGRSRDYAHPTTPKLETWAQHFASESLKLQELVSLRYEGNLMLLTPTLPPGYLPVQA